MPTLQGAAKSCLLRTPPQGPAQPLLTQFLATGASRWNGRHPRPEQWPGDRHGCVGCRRGRYPRIRSPRDSASSLPIRWHVRWRRLKAVRIARRQAIVSNWSQSWRRPTSPACSAKAQVNSTRTRATNRPHHGGRCGVRAGYGDPPAAGNASPHRRRRPQA